MSGRDNSEKYFINWVNMHLARSNITINNFATDFADGITFVKFLENLSGRQTNAKMMEPKNEIFKLQNCKVGIDMAKTMVKNLMINGRNLIQGSDIDVKLIIGFIFDLVLHYQVNDIQVQSAQGKQLTGRDGLLAWCSQKVNDGNPGPQVSDFKNGWANGISFMKLADTHDQNAFNIDEEVAKGDELPACKDRLRRVFDYFYDNLNVTKILDEDFAQYPDDKACITYLSLIYQALNSQKSGSSIQKLIKRAREIERMENDASQMLQQFTDELNTAQEDVKQSEAVSSDNLDKLQQQLRDIFEKQRKYSRELNKRIVDLESIIDHVNQCKQSYGFKGVYKLPQDRQIQDLQGDVKRLQDTCYEIINKLKIKIDDQKLTKTDLRKQQWKKLFEKYAVSNPTYIQQNELEQLLIAQELNTTDLGKLYMDGQQVDFEVFCTLMERLDQDNDNNEVVIQAFKDLSRGSDVITKNDLSVLKLSDDDIGWLIGKMKETDGGYDYKAFVDQIYQE